MTQPTPYDQAFDFSDYTTSNPSDPIPGIRIDTELTALTLTTDEILANLVFLQNDDTSLKNASVHKDAFDADALALMGGSWTPQGSWVTSTAYAVSDVVETNGSSYVCSTAHTSGTFSTDDSSGYWTIVANPGLGSGSVYFERISGDGSTGPFTLSLNMGTDEQQFFVIGPSNGTSKVLDPAADYTVSGTSLTFGSSTTIGTNNYIIWSVSSTAATAAASAEIAKDDAETAQAAAEVAQTAAETAQTAAETAADNFDDTYLGAKASDPTLDNDGDPLNAGDLYFNTSSNVMKYYTGSTWNSLGANTDETSKVSANDTTAGYLNGKLVAGANITMTENLDGGNETLTVSNSGPGLGMILALG
jgi:hypothetical protein